MPSITIMNGEQAGAIFHVGNRTLSVGRGPSQDIQVRDPKVTRRHLLIRRDGERHVVRELRTKNGMYVNSARTAECELADGDEIRLGDTILLYRLAEPEETTDAERQPHLASRKYREERTTSGWGHAVRR